MFSTISLIINSKLCIMKQLSLFYFGSNNKPLSKTAVQASTKSVFHKNSGKITIKLKFSKQIKEEDFINDFSAYTEEPEGLREFINELKANYI